MAVQETDSGWRVGYVNLAPTPRRGTQVEEALAQGASPADAAARTGSAIEPADDVRATADYKRALAAVLTRRALESAS